LTDTHAPRQLPGCAVLLRSAGADPVGTASPMGGWLLVEHPGPWPAGVVDQVLTDAMSAGRLRQLHELQAARAIRPLLIRRPGRDQAARPAGLRVMVGGARGRVVGGTGPVGDGRPWLEALDVDDPDDLGARLDQLDLGAALAAGTVGGRRVDGPLFLVCTHGTKDVCCATEGRPIAAGLARRHPGRVWETTHLGGDRWAANLLTVPAGYLHGHVDAEQAGRVADAALAGLVELDRLRGRTVLAPWAQAAEVAVRRKTGRLGLGMVAVADARMTADPDKPAAGADEYVVAVDAGPERWLATVRQEALGVCGTSRCAGVLRPSAWVVSGLEPAPDPAG
jgi:sucrase/ferredoxin-like protein